MFSGFPASENMPFLYPFSMHLFFSLSLFLSERSHLSGAPVSSRAQSASGSHCEWEVARERAVRSPSLSPGSRAKHVLLVPRCCYSAPKQFPILLVCIWRTSNVWIWCMSYSVSSGPLLPQLSIISGVAAFFKTLCPRSCNYYVIVNDLTFPGFLWSREAIFSALGCRGNWGTGWITFWFNRTCEQKFLLI